MSPEDRVRIRHIVDAAREAIAFAEGQIQESLEADHMRALAITRLLEIMGEAATTVSPELKAAHPQIPWRSMATTRNHLIHAYFNVDIQIVLNTVQVDLPPLITNLEALMTSESLKEAEE